MTLRDTALLRMLREGDPDLVVLQEDFFNGYGTYDIVCFYEEDESAIYGTTSTVMPILWHCKISDRTKIVTKQSASFPGKRRISLATDHSGLNKYSGVDDENYGKVYRELWRIVEQAPSIVRERFFQRCRLQVTSSLWFIS